MFVLIVFAFVAGAATAVSPCVLPVLPVALAAGATGGRRRPLGVVSGLALSFTFATVALVYAISALGLPDGLLRTAAIAVLIGFGICLLAPPLGDRLEAALLVLAAAVECAYRNLIGDLASASARPLIETQRSGVETYREVRREIGCRRKTG